MPIKQSKVKFKQEKKSSGGGGGIFGKHFFGSKVIHDTVKGAKDIAAGTPGGLIAQGTAVGKDVNDLAHGDWRKARRYSHMQNQWARDFRGSIAHPGRNPALTAVNVLGLAPVPIKGGQLIGRGARGARAASEAGFANRVEQIMPKQYKRPKQSVKQAFKQGAAKKPVARTRTVSYIPKTLEEAREMHDAAFSMPKWQKEANELQLKNGKKAKFAVTVQIEHSKSPVTRAAQTARDTKRSEGSSRKTVAKKLARDRDIINRPQEEVPLGFVGTSKQQWKQGKKNFSPYSGKQNSLKSIGNTLLGDVNSGIRAGRLYRGAYVLPNWLGAQATNLIQMGPKNYARLVGKQHKLRKSNPAGAQMRDKLAGETIGQAMMDVPTSGALSELTKGIGTSLGKATDRAARNRAILHELEQEGVTDLSRFEKEVSKGMKADPKVLQKLVNAVDRGEKNAIKFTRSKPLKGFDTKTAQLDRILANNVFLYKWITGSGGYTARMLKEHPTLSAVLATQGQQSPSIHDVLENVPQFMERYVPVSGGKKLVNPQAASLFDMPGDVAQNFYNALTGDALSAGENLNPTWHALLTAISGENVFTGRHLKEDKRSPWDRFKFASESELSSIPWFKLAPHQIGGRFTYPGTEGYDQSNRLFPLSNQDILLQIGALGGLMPTNWNKDTANRMGIEEKSRRTGQKPKKKRKKRSSSF